MANTLLGWMYRDAANYKQHREVVLAGELTPEQTRTVWPALGDGECFLPAQVGLDVLCTRWGTAYPDADHVWHELRWSRPTAPPPWR